MSILLDKGNGAGSGDGNGTHGTGIAERCVDITRNDGREPVTGCESGAANGDVSVGKAGTLPGTRRRLEFNGHRGGFRGSVGILHCIGKSGRSYRI